MRGAAAGRGLAAAGRGLAAARVRTAAPRRDSKPQPGISVVPRSHPILSHSNAAGPAPSRREGRGWI